MGIPTETGVIQRFLHQSIDRWHPAVLTPSSRPPADVGTTMIYTHVLNRGGRGVTHQPGWPVMTASAPSPGTWGGDIGTYSGLISGYTAQFRRIPRQAGPRQSNINGGYRGCSWRDSCVARTRYTAQCISGLKRFT